MVLRSLNLPLNLATFHQVNNSKVASEPTLTSTEKIVSFFWVSTTESLVVIVLYEINRVGQEVIVHFASVTTQKFVVPKHASLEYKKLRQSGTKWFHVNHLSSQQHLRHSIDLLCLRAFLVNTSFHFGPHTKFTILKLYFCFNHRGLVKFHCLHPTHLCWAGSWF
jgi:hypothetical protein